MHNRNPELSAAYERIDELKETLTRARDRLLTVADPSGQADEAVGLIEDVLDERRVAA